MVKQYILIALLLALGLLPCQTKAQNGHPEITGQPKVYSPDLLAWPRDFNAAKPDLSEPTSNRIYDLHLQLNNCEDMDLIVSTSGNYHMALTDFWYNTLLKEHPIKNWYFSTSPPISVDQASNSTLNFGNVGLNCMPHIAVGPKGIMDSLRQAGLTVGMPIPIFTNRGNVLLVKKGNPKGINSLYDLAQPNVTLATSNPYSEPGSFGNYATSIFQMALQDRGQEAAQKLFTTLFGANTNKWVVGKRIHHREVPHLVYTGQADVGIVFYHLARYFKNTFPNQFDIIPLGGTIQNPAPMPGNKIAKLYAVKINTPLTEKQEFNRTLLLTLLHSESFHKILLKHYINPVP